MMRQVFEGRRDKVDDEGSQWIGIKPVDENEMFKGRIFAIKINSDSRVQLIEQLSDLGIDEKHLFHGKDDNAAGLSAVCDSLNAKIDRRIHK